MDINEMNFPQVTEGDRVLWQDDNWYVYTDGTWVKESK